MKQNEQIEKHIAVLDGIRAIAVVMVVWFHFWQQTWLTPYINFDNNPRMEQLFSGRTLLRVYSNL